MKTLTLSLLLASALAYSAWHLPWVSYDQLFAECVNRHQGEVLFCDALIPQE